MNKAHRTLPCIAFALLAGGCSSGGSIFSGFGQNQNEAVPNATESSQSESLEGYFQLMEDLLEGDTVVQAEAFQRVSADEAAAPNVTNRLRLALSLGIPGHAGSNAEHAQRELRELLAAGEVLLPEERILAALLLTQIEQRLLLDLEAEQTQAAAVESMEAQTSELEQLIAQLQNENQSLRRDLEQAQNIIDEITNIEQSIRERASAD